MVGDDLGGFSCAAAQMHMYVGNYPREREGVECVCQAISAGYMYVLYNIFRLEVLIEYIRVVRPGSSQETA